MNVIMLPGGVLRVPSVVDVEGVKVHGTRDLSPDSPDYHEWLPYAETEDQIWSGLDDADDAAIIARWEAAASA
ncbi:hypothetical protein [Rhizohabitans arisaemae]|uniref:hypothetical protein n=1 Tax=Rhizohabitans arisaemae TaxID=2720610 RepID=UPI0024B15752|nr:hypothetical protein [Rhizohabitans arisaemae]